MTGIAPGGASRRRGLFHRPVARYALYLLMALTLAVSYRIALGRVHRTERGMMAAHRMMLARRYDVSLEMFDRVIAANPRMNLAWSGRGLCLLNLERYGEALQSYDHAIGLDDKNLIALRGRGVTLEKLGRIDEAIAACDVVLALQPGDIPSLRLKDRLLQRQ